jgi:stearoyl-CoA desaturase (delta-9 desaturase)
MSADAKMRTAREIPLTIVPAPPRRRAMLAIAGLVVFGPAVGTAAAAALTIVRGGVTGTALGAFAVLYIISMLGITVGFHRYFAHRAFRAGRWMEALFIAAGSTALQGPLLFWVSTHRRHHLFSDTVDDPHSPHFANGRAAGYWRGLWQGHIGWMFAHEVANPMRFAPDIVRERRVFAQQQRYWLWAGIALAMPPLAALAAGTGPLNALEIFLWAGPVRLFVAHHASWAVGSLSHMTGRRPFATNDRSANNFFVAILAFGEGLQNNHHSFPRAAHHRVEWWEPDLSGYAIDLLAFCGLVWDVNRIRSEEIRARRAVQ